MLIYFRLGRLLGVIAVVAAVCYATSSAQAFVGQLESLQKANGAIHQFKFEGDEAAARQNNSGGLHVDLLAAAGEGGAGTNDPDGVPDSGDEVDWSYPAGDVNAIGYEAGYDGAGVSQAMRPQSTPVSSTFAGESLAQRRSGAGLYLPSFTTPSMMTIEGVLMPDPYVDTSGNPHYVFQTRPGGGRGYYLAQIAPMGSRDVGGTLASIVGDSFGERPAVVQDYVDPSHWYYVAVTFDLSGSNAVVDAFYADLTDGGPLTQSQDGYNFAATIGSGLVGANGLAGVGMFVRPGTTVLGQEFYFGAIDNLAIYGDKLTDDQVARNFRALTTAGVPEPASIALVCLGLGLFGLRCRSR
jgi:hypothetical protein